MKLCVIVTKYVKLTREEAWSGGLRTLTRRKTLQASSVKTHLPEVPHGVPEDDDQLGEGCWEQRRPEASELSSAVVYSSACCFCTQERAL
jgi:hypothetical protein